MNSCFVGIPHTTTYRKVHVPIHCISHIAHTYVHDTWTHPLHVEGFSPRYLVFVFISQLIMSKIRYTSLKLMPRFRMLSDMHFWCKQEGFFQKPEGFLQELAVSPKVAKWFFQRVLALYVYPSF